MREPRRARSRVRLVAALAAAILGGLLLSACGGSDASEEAADVEVFGNWVGEPAERFRDVLSAFEDQSGLTVRYLGSRQFNGDLRERIGDGDAPDIAIVSQPALLFALAAEGDIPPLPADIATRVRANLPPAAAGLGNLDGDLVGVPFRLHLKSLVWYSPDEFGARDYTVPTTWEELAALTDRMRDDGLTPWCAGIRSVGGASGWVATDWIEDLVLRLHGADVYDAWVAGEITFEDPRIREAFELFDDVLLEPGETLGGRRAILNTDWRDAATPLLQADPPCALHRNASFYEENLPDDVTIRPDGDLDVFVLPPISDAAGKAGVLSGEQAAGFNTRPETLALLEFLATPEAALPWADATGFISPYLDADMGSYGRDFERRVTDLLGTFDSLRFDGSDLMPSSLGAQSFFDGMLHFVRTSDFEETLEIIEAGYPAGDAG